MGTVSNETELRDVYVEANRVLELANMPLQQWATNCARVNKLIERREPISEIVNILGLNWFPGSDEINLNNPNWTKFNENLTKRQLASQVAQLYDPLGLLSPFTIRGKMLVQEAWKLSLGWDESLPDEMVNRWNEIKGDLRELQTIRFPRHVLQSGLNNDLHVFSDASVKGYGAVAYAVA